MKIDTSAEANKLTEEEKSVLVEIFIKWERRNELASKMDLEIEDIKEIERGAIRKLVRRYILRSP